MPRAAEAQLAVLLPHREVYQPDGAGAVVSCVRDMALHSRYRTRLVVLGDEVPDPFAQPPLLPVTRAAWYYGRRTARYVEGAARCLGNLQPALVEIHNRPSYITRLRKALPEVSLLLYLHNDPPGMRGFKTVSERQRILGLVDGVVCVSSYIRSRLMDGLPAAMSAKVNVVLNGVDTSAIADSPLQARRKEILFVGRLIPEKGGLVFAQAAAIARAQIPDWRFVMIGAWGFRNEAELKSYERETRDAMSALAQQGEMTGYLPRAEVYARMLQAAIVVVPSLWEDPCPLAVIEAMACGCALIAARRGGIPELVEQAGLVTEEMSAHALAQQMIALAQDETRRTHYQMLARERALRQLDIRVASARLDAVRERMLQSA